jgi:hypothetical protein
MPEQFISSGPTSLLFNCSYKIFTRVLTNMIWCVIDRLIVSNQTDFRKGRYILESIVTPHEVMHSVHQGKERGLVLKLDYEKAYDKLIESFWLMCSKKEALVANGYDGSKIFFDTEKGLR